MPANSVVLLILAAIFATILVLYWRQVLTGLLIISSTIFWYGLLQIISLFDE